MNDNEKRIAKALEDRGFEVLRNGWPDFLIMSKGWDRGFCLEYKHYGDHIRPEQKRMHLALARFGIPTYIGRPDLAEVLRKQGKAIVLPEDYASLKRRIGELENEVNNLAYKLKACNDAVNATPILLEPPQPDVQELVDLGAIHDGDPSKVHEAEERQRQRDMQKAVAALPEFVSR